jgi:CubicO group peptidase (beta-lactamase class C family)
VAASHDTRIARALTSLQPERAASRRAGVVHDVAQRMADTATPGLAVAVIDGYAPVGSLARGTRGQDAGPVLPDTPFQAGSVSKAVFAVTVMRLVQDGVLDLDADVDDYLTSWHLPAQDGWRPRLTLRRLLSHTAGTTVHGFKGYPAGAPLPTVAQLLDGAAPANSPPVTVDLLPGVQARYSGGGTTIAQLAVTDRVGRPLPELVRALVLEPLGMHDSGFEQPPPAARTARAAIGHPWNGVAVPGGWHVYPEMAAAGLWTTAPDLARFGAAVLATLAGRGTPLGLARETVEIMLRPPLADIRAGDDFFGLGWFCAGAGAGFRFGHPGSNEGYVAELRCVRATGQGAVVMLNANQGDVVRAEVLAALAREYGWPALGGPAGISDARGCAGRYRDDHGREVAITDGADGLQLRVADQPPLALRALSDREFEAIAVGLRVRFEPEGARRVTGLTLIQGGKTLTLARHAGDDGAP